MHKIDPQSPHTFHVPVMGTGFLIDSPLRVARFGVTTVLSLVDDHLIEQMRKFHCEKEGEPYEEIAQGEEDARARRITSYLNFMNRIVRRQTETLRAAPFTPDSEITRYFELLPNCPQSQAYRAMLAVEDDAERLRLQTELRGMVVAGRIDVNIMSKGDRDAYVGQEKMPQRYSDALSALRGYAQSDLRSAIVFSAGLNPRLYAYATEFADFMPDESGDLKKQIILKVSDFRSAEIQGKYLAKRGLWVSEYRIESGLNCGGHAFPTKGELLGPILDEFVAKKHALHDDLCKAYSKALGDRAINFSPACARITVQGGIGTAAEDALLRTRFEADGTGWGTPFLLVPEVSNVDAATIEKLIAADENNVFLSDSSPFGMPFWNLRNSASEEARLNRIAEGHPGSACWRGYAKLFNTEFTAIPLCTASREFQRLKLAQLDQEPLDDARREALRQSVLAKSCICHDLAGGATLKNGIDLKATPAICPGPNVVNFSQILSLDEIVSHIYGRKAVPLKQNRPHMLLRELEIYIDFLKRELKKRELGLTAFSDSYFAEYKENLSRGAVTYRSLVDEFVGYERVRFVAMLESLIAKLDAIELPAVASETSDELKAKRPAA